MHGLNVRLWRIVKHIRHIMLCYTKIFFQQQPASFAAFTNNSTFLPCLTWPQNKRSNNNMSQSLFFPEKNSIASEQKWASHRLDTKFRCCGGRYGIPIPSMGRTAYLPISLHNLPSKSTIHLRYIYCIHHFDPIGYLGCDFKYYTKKKLLGELIQFDLRIFFSRPSKHPESPRV